MNPLRDKLKRALGIIRDTLAPRLLCRGPEPNLIPRKPFVALFKNRAPCFTFVQCAAPAAVAMWRYGKGDVKTDNILCSSASAPLFTIFHESGDDMIRIVTS